MAKDAGYTLMTCDRDQAVEYIKESDTKANNRWHRVQRVSKDGELQDWLFCDKCYSAYNELVKDQDFAFNAFMETEA